MAGGLVAGHTAAVSNKRTGKVDIVNTATAGLSAFLLVYSLGMSAYGVYETYCYCNGITPVTNIGGNPPASPTEGGATSFRATRAAKRRTPVIGKMSDLEKAKLKGNEFKVADLLDDMGSPKANWKNNSGVLRSLMDGGPIRDVSPYPMTNAGFLGLERNLLQNHGYTYQNGYWIR